MRSGVSVGRWGLWWVLLILGVLVFYILLTPIWLGIRAAARLAELKARRRPPSP